MSSSSSSSSSSKSTYEEENDTTNSTDTMTTEQIFKGMERRNKELELAEADGSLQRAKEMHVDDLSSDDEEAINTIGDVPLHWYEEHDHIGYTLDGKRLQKASRGDGLDRYLASQDDPNYRRTVYDAYNDREVVLSDRQMLLIRRMMSGTYAHPEFNDTPDYVRTHSNKVQIHAMGVETEPKRRFIPSKWERQKVMKIVKGIREGRIKINEKKEPKQEEYLLWGDDNTTGEEQGKGKGPPPIQAPKLTLPGHNASYNPPKEYLPTEEEKKEWEEMDPEDRPDNFIPRGYDSMRKVPAYNNFVKERFERCLDLHLAPRAKLHKLNINPDSLLPRLPSVTELKPFPNALAITFEGVHEGRIRALSVSPSAQYLATGGDDGRLALWEITTGRCINQVKFDQTITCVEWNPRPDKSVVAVGCGKNVYLLNTFTENEENNTSTIQWMNITSDGKNAISTSSNEEDINDSATLLKKQKELISWKSWDYTVNSEEKDSNSDSDSDDDDDDNNNNSKNNVNNNKYSGKHLHHGLVLNIHNGESVLGIAWHGKGDYLSTLMHGGAKTKAVLIHQVSKRSSRAPFTKDVLVQAIKFHPTKPFFFVASQTTIRIYNLQRQTMIKKLKSGAKWISSIDIHPGGDHLIIGSYDKRLCWFDLDLSDRPYKTLRYHEKGIRSVAFHKQYPLMASASDDGTIHIFHARVYNDLIQNPLIVPVKVLKGHKSKDRLGVMKILFHPTLPWLFSCGSDGGIHLFQNL